MAYNFTADWADEIAEVSTLPEFQNATVTIKDPSLASVQTPLDWKAGTREVVTGDTVIYSGRARVIALRSTQYVNGEVTGNSREILGVRVQLPRVGVEELGYGETEYSEGEYGETLEGDIDLMALRVKKGCTLTVDSSPRQPALTSYVFVAVSDFQGSQTASRTLEFSVDLDTVRNA